MSGIVSPPATALTMELMLQLMEFVKSPDYAEKLRELVAAQVAHDQAAVTHSAEHKLATEAQAKLDADMMAHKALWMEQDTKHQVVHDSLSSREKAVSAREKDLAQREKDHAAKVEKDLASIASSKESLDATARRLNELSARLDERRTGLDVCEADLNRRLTKIREAAA